MVGTQQLLPGLASFDEYHPGLLQMTQFAQRIPQHVLESGHHQRITYSLTFQLQRRLA